MMPALFINLRIQDEEKFNLFKTTLADLAGLFSECHIKFRGLYRDQCIEFTHEIFHSNESLTYYQDLPEDDWVDTALNMMRHVKSRAVFIYFEDHKLVSTREHLADVLDEFNQRQLDYLCYSWFQASVLGIENLLPLNPEYGANFNVFEYTKKQNALVGKISPGFYSFSLLSVCSVDYFRMILTSCNLRYKFYNKPIASIVSRLFPYPKNRVVARLINHYAKKFDFNLCFYSPSSPFNLEKIWFETEFMDRPLRFGVLSNELYANFDDDNGSYKETLLKRGLYPFEATVKTKFDDKKTPDVSFQINLKDGDKYDCTYFSHVSRIQKAPVVQITVESGKAVVNYQSLETTLEADGSKCFFSNKGPVISSMGESVITIGLFDECF